MTEGLLRWELLSEKKFDGKWYKFKVIKSFQYGPLAYEWDRAKFLQDMCELQKQFNTEVYAALLFADRTEAVSITGEPLFELDDDQREEKERMEALIMIGL